MSKTNPEIHGFSNIPIRESHAHLCFEKPIAETVENFKNVLHHFNCSSLNINAVPVSYGKTENLQTIYCKSVLAPNIFASAGLLYYLDGRDTPEEMLNQLKEYMAMGFKGEILDKIYRKNFERLYGNTPKPLDTERINAYAEKFMAENKSLNETEANNMKVIAEYFKNK